MPRGRLQAQPHLTWRRISAVFLDTTSWLTLASLQSTSAVSLRAGRPTRFQMPLAGRGGKRCPLASELDSAVEGPSPAGGQSCLGPRCQHGPMQSQNVAPELIQQLVPVLDLQGNVTAMRLSHSFRAQRSTGKVPRRGQSPSLWDPSPPAACDWMPGPAPPCALPGPPRGSAAQPPGRPPDSDRAPL